MTAAGRGSAQVPGLVRAYAGLVAEAVAITLGADLQGVWIGGSLALDDFLASASDIDLLAVSARPLSLAARRDLPARLHHDSLPCPAVGMDLLVFTREQVASPSRPARYELALTTGSRWGMVVEASGADDEVLLDLEIARRAGVALAGPPAASIIAEVPAARLREALLIGLEWHRQHLFDPDHDPRGDEAALAACRALHFAATGELVSKTAAGRKAARAPGHGVAAGAALARREGRIRTSLRGDEVRPLLAAAARALEAR